MRTALARSRIGAFPSGPGGHSSLSTSAGTTRVTRFDPRLTVEAEGVRLTLSNAEVRTEGESLRIRLAPRR